MNVNIAAVSKMLDMCVHYKSLALDCFVDTVLTW